MALTPDQYKESGLSDASDWMERGQDAPWPDDQQWDLGGVTVSEGEMRRAIEEFEKTGKRPDWAYTSNDESHPEGGE